MKPAFARLHILLARDAPFGLVIRHGTAKSVCTLLWDRKNDRFTLGQWMRGRIDLETCDLSPSGQHFLYSARKYSNTNWQTTLGWTVVSRAPYLKAVAYYPGNSGGGWFVNDREYCVPCVWANPENRESPEVRRVEPDGPPIVSLPAARLKRDGWIAEDRRALFAGRLEFVRPAGCGWELRYYLRGRYRLSCGELVADTRDWDWADLDNKRLVWTSKGCLWAGVVRKHGIDQITLLQDFNGMKFEALIAPYEGGRPVQRTPLPPVAAIDGKVLRRLPREPTRKKPNRLRVRPDEDP